MNVLFLRFLDKVLSMVDKPVVLFDKELNPVKANASGWQFFNACRKNPSFLCEGCPLRKTKEACLPCAKRCSQGIVQSEPLHNAEGVLEGVVITLICPEDCQYRRQKLEEVNKELTVSNNT